MDAIHTIQCSLDRIGDELVVKSTLDDTRRSSPHSTFALPGSIIDWRSKLTGRIHEAKYNYQEDVLDIDANLGADLLHLLFPGEDDKNLLKFATQISKSLLLEITTNDLELANLPWEVCNHPDREALGLDNNFDCEIYVTRAPLPHDDKWSVDEPVRILVVGPSPLGIPPANFSQELKAIQRGLENGFRRKSGYRYEVKDKYGVTLSNLESIASEYKPHIVHIVSHGEAGSLQFEQMSGHKIDATGNDIAKAILSAKEKPSIFVSTACLIMQNDLEQGLLGFGDALIENIPYVIGMQLGITGERAVDFSGNFYEGLASSFSVIQSYLSAQKSIFNRNPASPEWISPVLYKRYSKDNIVFSKNFIDAFVVTNANRLDLLVEALKYNEDDVTGWDELKNMINQIERYLVHPIKRGDVYLDPQKTSMVRELGNLIVSIRGYLINIKQALAGKNVFGDPDRYGNRIAELFNILDEMYLKMIELHNKFL